MPHSVSVLPLQELVILMLAKNAPSLANTLKALPYGGYGDIPENLQRIVSTKTMQFKDLRIKKGLKSIKLEARPTWLN